jgi:hypothetical protein
MPNYCRCQYHFLDPIQKGEPFGHGEGARIDLLLSPAVPRAVGEWLHNCKIIMLESWVSQPALVGKGMQLREIGGFLFAAYRNIDT